jgi:hypothetical protein
MERTEKTARHEKVRHAGITMVGSGGALGMNGRISDQKKELEHEKKYRVGVNRGRIWRESERSLRAGSARDQPIERRPSAVFGSLRAVRVGEDGSMWSRVASKSQTQFSTKDKPLRIGTAAELKSATKGGKPRLLLIAGSPLARTRARLWLGLARPRRLPWVRGSGHAGADAQVSAVMCRKKPIGLGIFVAPLTV